MILSPYERSKEDETPISPTPDSPVPEIFSTKKIFFLNSTYSGSRRSEIPHIEPGRCPRDEVSRRLFHQRSDSCDCDCASDGCWGCLRRNKQFCCKIFVLALSIVLVILLFGSLSYNLTRSKGSDESVEFDLETKWVSHYHNYNTSVNVKKNTTREAKVKMDLPVPLYENPYDYDSSDDFQEREYQIIEIRHNQKVEEIEPLSYNSLDTQKQDSRDPALIIPDRRDPQRSKRSVHPPSNAVKVTRRNENQELRRNENQELSTENDKGGLYREFEKTLTSRKSKYPHFLEELKGNEDGMKIYGEKFLKNARTVFQAFSLTTPGHSTPLQSEEYSIETNDIGGESRFIGRATVENFATVAENYQETYTENLINLRESSKEESASWNAEIENWLVGTTEKEVDNNIVEKAEESTGFYFSADDSLIYTTENFHTVFNDENSSDTTVKLVGDIDPRTDVPEDFSVTSQLTTWDKMPTESETNRNDFFFKWSSTRNDLIGSQSTGVRTEEPRFAGEKVKAFGEDEFRTQPVFQVSLPFPGVLNANPDISSDSKKLDKVIGISLAEAKEKEKESRKRLFLNSKVVGGSFDVRLPTGPDVSKPFGNAFETLKTSQQLSFSPSAGSQYILPYQMCFFASPGPRPSIRSAQSRTFPFAPLFSSLVDKDTSVKHSFHFPTQQNFLSFSVNNYANSPSPPARQQLQFPPSGGSVFNFPSQQQFPHVVGNVSAPHTQPLFCTYLQLPLFQFPTVPGSADFVHAKCVDCDENSRENVSSTRERAFYPGEQTICSGDNIACRDGSYCIPITKWCDNEVHCKDASDEEFCSCRERVDRERLCDGYIDCPHGEDEVGCFDCPKSAFSCDNAVSPESCISLNKRCDGVRDCATNADETDCSALFFHVQQNGSHHVSQVNGFLHHNWKGDWFPVCVEIGNNVWAKEACLGELGYLPLQVEVTFSSVPEYYKGPFIVRHEDGTIALQDHCKGHLSTYVQCPSMKCGTRADFYRLQEFENRFKRFVRDDLQQEKAHVSDKPFMTWWDNLRREVAGKFHVKDVYGKISEVPEIQWNTSRLKRGETGRVVGGVESEPKAWPWTIAIYKDGGFHCGGVILDERWILTAAHCMEHYWKHFYEVRGGMLRRFSFSAMEQVRSVSHVIVHENYDPTIMSNDLALLRLQEPFHFNKWLRPGCLPSLQEGISKFLWGPAPGTKCIAVGWGAVREHGTDPDQLREVEIPIMSRCKHKEDLTGAEICAGKAEGGKDTCQGDSGGPLLCRDSSTPSSWYVAGIVSHGEGCARPGEPGAYTRISLFVDWITANTNDFQLPSVKPLKNCPGFRCNSGSRLCIPMKWVCNKFTDCLEAEDEKNCTSGRMGSDVLNEQSFERIKYTEVKNIVENEKLKENFLKNSENKSSTIEETVNGVNASLNKKEITLSSSKRVDTKEQFSGNCEKEYSMGVEAIKTTDLLSQKSNSSAYQKPGVGIEDVSSENEREIAWFNKEDMSITRLSPKGFENENDLFSGEEKTSTVIWPANFKSEKGGIRLNKGDASIMKFSPQGSENKKQEVVLITEVLKSTSTTPTTLKKVKDETWFTGDVLETTELSLKSSLKEEKPSTRFNEKDASIKQLLLKGSENEMGVVSRGGALVMEVPSNTFDITIQEDELTSKDSMSTTVFSPESSKSEETWFNRQNVSTLAEDSGYKKTLVNAEFIRSTYSSPKSPKIGSPQTETNEGITTEVLTSMSFENEDWRFQFSEENLRTTEGHPKSSAFNKEDINIAEFLYESSETESEEGISRTELSLKPFGNLKAETWPSKEDVAITQLSQEKVSFVTESIQSSYASPEGTINKDEQIFMSEDLRATEIHTTKADVDDEVFSNIESSNFENEFSNGRKGVTEISTNRKQINEEKTVVGREFAETEEMIATTTENINRRLLKNEEDKRLTAGFVQNDGSKGVTESSRGRAQSISMTASTSCGQQHSLRNRETDGTDLDYVEMFSAGTTDSLSEHDSTNEDTDSVRKRLTVNNATSDYFQCEEIVQSVLSGYRCDGIRDCEDGTDEKNCDCGKVLMSLNPKLICDSRIDCADLSDEKNCKECPENGFYCKMSRECVPSYERCNGIIKCRLGEDERNCLSLAENGEVRLLASGEPILQTKGMLMTNKKKIWSPECQEESSAFGAGVAIAVCSSAGTIGYEKYENKTLQSDCRAFQVTCSEGLVSSLEKYGSREEGYFWPWNAFVYSDGIFICSAVLLRPVWLLTSSQCLKNSLYKKNYIVVTLGRKKPGLKLREPSVQTIRVDGIRFLRNTDIVLLHLSREVNQTEHVRPIGIPYIFDSDPEKDLCVATGDRDIFLKILEDCSEGSRCYTKVMSTPANCKSKPWLGAVVCQSRLGWYPSSVFAEKDGYCGFENVSLSSVQENLQLIYSALGKQVEVIPEPSCSGFRCSEGLCIPLKKICDGWPDCPSKDDEHFESCRLKEEKRDCNVTELKCRNGLCIPKVLFADGKDDCGDRSDEPRNATCLDYLRLTAPQRICDGIRNCYDKSDEDYKWCPCEDFKFKCKMSLHCIPQDFVCDGEKDCPGGEDEELCMGRKTVKDHKKNRLEIMQNSYGIWHDVCLSRVSEYHSNALCRDLGFKKAILLYNKNRNVLVPKIDPFSWVKLNQKTSVALRGDKPFVRLVRSRRTCVAVKCA